MADDVIYLDEEPQTGTAEQPQSAGGEDVIYLDSAAPQPQKESSWLSSAGNWIKDKAAGLLDFYTQPSNPTDQQAFDEIMYRQQKKENTATPGTDDIMQFAELMKQKGITDFAPIYREWEKLKGGRDKVGATDSLILRRYLKNADTGMAGVDPMTALKNIPAGGAQALYGITGGLGDLAGQGLQAIGAEDLGTALEIQSKKLKGRANAYDRRYNEATGGDIGNPMRLAGEMGLAMSPAFTGKSLPGIMAKSGAYGSAMGSSRGMDIGQALGVGAIDAATAGLLGKLMNKAKYKNLTGDMIREGDVPSTFKEELQYIAESSATDYDDLLKKTADYVDTVGGKASQTQVMKSAVENADDTVQWMLKRAANEDPRVKGNILREAHSRSAAMRGTAEPGSALHQIMNDYTVPFGKGASTKNITDWQGVKQAVEEQGVELSQAAKKRLDVYSNLEDSKLAQSLRKQGASVDDFWLSTTPTGTAMRTGLGKVAAILRKFGLGSKVNQIVGQIAQTGAEGPLSASKIMEALSKADIPPEAAQTIVKQIGSELGEGGEELMSRIQKAKKDAFDADKYEYMMKANAERGDSSNAWKMPVGGDDFTLSGNDMFRYGLEQEKIANPDLVNKAGAWRKGLKTPMEEQVQSVVEDIVQAADSPESALAQIAEHYKKNPADVVDYIENAQYRGKNVYMRPEVGGGVAGGIIGGSTIDEEGNPQLGFSLPGAMAGALLGHGASKLKSAMSPSSSFKLPPGVSQKMPPPPPLFTPKMDVKDAIKAIGALRAELPNSVNQKIKTLLLEMRKGKDMAKVQRAYAAVREAAPEIAEQLDKIITDVYGIGMPAISKY